MGKTIVLLLWAFCGLHSVLGQGQWTSPVARVNTNIQSTSVCGSATQSVQKATTNSKNVFYNGDKAVPITFTVNTNTAGTTYSVNLIKYQSQGTTTVLPSYDTIGISTGITVAGTGAKTVTIDIPADTVCDQSATFGCALTWEQIPTTGNHYVSCADIFIFSRANDARITFYISQAPGSNTVSLPPTNLKDRFVSFFGFPTNYVKLCDPQPVADGNGNWAAVICLSDGLNGQTSQNMSDTVQRVLKQNPTGVASAFGQQVVISNLDVDDPNTRSNKKSSSTAAIVVIVVFLLLTAIVMGIIYYYWKHDPQKLRTCMHCMCPCFGSGGGAKAASTSSGGASTGGGGGYQPSVPKSGPPQRQQLNI